MIRRHEQVNWRELLQQIETDPEQAKQTLKNYSSLGKNSDDWQAKIKKESKQIEAIQGTKWAKPSQVYHVTVSITYNESAQIIYNSLMAAYEAASGNYANVFAFISQEQRMGEKYNRETIETVRKLAGDKFNIQVFQEDDLKIVYETNHNQLTDYTYKQDIQISADKLNVFFTAHPDGLVGEIKGSGPNANWGARQASLLLAHLKIDPEMAILTKLDADHRLGPNYLEQLTYNYILNPAHPQVGFEPVPIFINNYNETGIVPRIVGIQSTFWIMTQSILPQEFHFFMCYAVPIHTLREAGFWYREVISEECFVFYQCYLHYNGEFRTHPVYAPIMVDAVEGATFLDTLGNQYKQLQRWAWGAIEEFPYIFTRLFILKEGEKIDTRERIRLIYLNFTNSIFWATSGPVFGLGVFLPAWLGGNEYSSMPISLSLKNISSTFMYLSFSLLVFSIYINFYYLAPKIIQKELNLKPKNTNVGPVKMFFRRLYLASQVLFSPIVYITIMPLPAIDAQVRGLLGKYLGYWVTPKGGK
ncbi:MAG: hypothetical protein OHK0017_12950 [Patescibacteria group bacterium]